MELLVFLLDGQRHAVPLGAVERVIHAVEVTPLPGAPRNILGAIDIAGHVVPVFSLRRRLGLPDLPVRPSDQFLIAVAGARSVGLLVDQVHGLTTSAAEVVDPAALGMQGQSFHGLLRLEDGLLLIHDLERFLTPEDERSLQAALGAAE